jgi:hypothetical protein
VKEEGVVARVMDDRTKMSIPTSPPPPPKSRSSHDFRRL